MSELIDARRTTGLFRWTLMAGVSMGALLAASIGSAHAADDTDRPTVWIELGGQLERADGGQERFAPPFLSEIDPAEFTSPLVAQRTPRYATGLEGSISFQPKESDWIFSAAVRYGRSNGYRKVHQEGPAETQELIESLPLLSFYYVTVLAADARRYSDVKVQNSENHAVVDFEAGRDLGIGLLGKDAKSVISAGVRFAQFQSRSTVSIDGDFDFAVSNKYATQIFGIPGYFKIPSEDWHLNRSAADVRRSFRGIGPAVAWKASVPMAGNADREELAFDWGVNAALLFGRQKVVAHHETHSYRHHNEILGQPIATTATPIFHDTARSQSVTVPNLGGFAGLSLKFPNAKISLGYRADVFFGAIDGGIDTRKTYDRSFYGPFANFSIGL